MGGAGGIDTAARQTQIADSVFDYLSRQDAIRNGVLPVADALPVPDILLLYNQLQAFPGTLPWKGGLLDQPYLLMLELAWCRQGVEHYQQALGAAQTVPNNETDRMAQILNQSML